MSGHSFRYLLNRRLGLYASWVESNGQKRAGKVGSYTYRHGECDITMCYNGSVCINSDSNHRWTYVTLPHELAEECMLTLGQDILR